jgi:hypothetical protein
LLLLIVYLVVIGPFDKYWLNKIKRPMLTWITFPCYVVFFSLMIYFIGYKLRAGESEWNELHVVDVLVHGNLGELRGRTYASIYSPVNAKYRVEGKQNCSTFRGEFQSSMSGSESSERAEVYQDGNNYRADIFVPVWTSQLFVSDWWLTAPVPIEARVVSDGGNWVVTVINHLEHPLLHAEAVLDDRIVELGSDVPPGASKTFHIARGQGARLQDFLTQQGANFASAASSRQNAFGSTASGQIGDLPRSSMAASFLSRTQQGPFEFISPPGLDLSPLVEEGDAIILAWSQDYSPIQPINQFSPRRSHRDTLWRLAVPVTEPSAPQ